MADPMLGDIRIFAGNFAPSGWLPCDGRLINISDNETLFVIIGTIYGGDGTTTFALPDLRGRVPLGGTPPTHLAGPGLSNYTVGETGGSEQVTLMPPQVPPHAHVLQGQNGSGNSADPTGRVPARPAPSGGLYKPGGTDTAMSSSSVSGTGSGGNQPHNNRQPYLTLNFIICVEGIFPVPV